MTTKPLWIITQEAVYRHKILGIFQTREQALEAFYNYYQQIKETMGDKYYHDFDGHHEYYLYNLDWKEHLPEGLKGEIFGEPLKYAAFRGKNY